MTKIERSIEIQRPQDEVFAILTNLDRLPEWATIVVETRGQTEPPLHAGDRFEQTVRVAGVNLESRWRVVEVDPPRMVEYLAEGIAGGRLHMTQRVSPTNTGSRVELEIDYDLPGGILGDVLDKTFVERRNEREAETSLQNLKDLLESGRA